MSDSKLYLLFGIHNHQPVGNFDSIFLKAYQECYYPFFKILKDYPEVKCNVHFSGPLWDWLIENKKTELTEILEELSERAQIEFLSSGYYEPILPIIPYRDQVNQIILMNEFLKKRFQKEPQGLWLTERVWEPSLVSVIKKAGLQFSLVDDAHFRYAGISSPDIFGFFTTEDNGQRIFLFPISKRLRYKIPFSSLEELINIFKGLKEMAQGKVVTIVDDGEKFGLWPYTYDWVYNRGWLKNFFAFLSENTSWIQTLTFFEVLNIFSSEGIIYIPTASYDEMMEWVLEPTSFKIFAELRQECKKKEEYLSFLRGGFFRNFFRKYPEINYMHKKMIYVSQKINQSLPLEEKDVYSSLFKAQCNCAYWHGVFGGFYLVHLRNAVYENLIKAQKLFEERTGQIFSHQELDIDFDGRKEIILNNRYINLVVSPHKGGSIQEFSSKRFLFNFVNTLSRREENYHLKIRKGLPSKLTFKKPESIHDLIKVKEDGLEDFLIYDNYQKVWLVDHLVDKDLTLDRVKRNSGLSTFFTINYEYFLNQEEKFIKLNLAGKDELLEVRKLIEFEDTSQLEIFYTIEPRNKNILQNKNFGVEFNISFASLSGAYFRLNNRVKFSLEEECILNEVNSFELIDENKGFRLIFMVDNIDLIFFPIYSVASSESGFNRDFQEITCIFVIDMEKKPEFPIRIRVEEHSS